uniref:Uncharacterized protein AlNc14C82G5346 n=1 Tax=Albugo laibachii Nc14 TaxID=890382 RepID=F0WFF7_9STRA|nr:conserved hypothetical protein [Albugo laibachii Nc14]|eukprot:CCA19939.1 conserved hypothetical protein [Albugo laibachii Nc14]
MSDLEAVPAIKWPVDRSDCDAVSEADVAAVDRFFIESIDQPLMIQWVLQYKQKKFQRRLLVVFPLRVHTFKKRRAQARNDTKLKSCKCYQWICLEALQVVTSDLDPFHTGSVRLIFDMNRSFNATNYHNNVPQCSPFPLRFRYNFSSVGGRGEHHEGLGSRDILHLHAGTSTETLVRLLQRIIHNFHLLYTSRGITGYATQHVLPAPHFDIPTRLNWLEYFVKIDASRDLVARFDLVTLAYRARCDDMGIQYHQDIMRRLCECISSSESFGKASLDLQYCLSETGRTNTSNVNWRRETQQLTLLQKAKQCILTLSKGDKGAQVSKLEGEILLQVLLACPTWFTEIAVKDRSLTKSENLLLSRLISRSEVTRVTMRNVGMDETTLLSLCKYLHHELNEDVPVEEQKIKRLECDFSHNTFDASMINALGDLLTTTECCTISQLYLQNCTLSVELSTKLLRRIKSAPNLSFSLRVLNLSSNNLGRAGTRAVSSWLATSSSLQILELADVELDLDAFCADLSRNSNLYEFSLTQLNLSHNVLQERASVYLGCILGKTQSLSALSLRGMRREEVKLDPCARFTSNSMEGRDHSDVALLNHPQVSGQMPPSLCLMMRRCFKRFQTLCRTRRKTTVNYLKFIVHPFLKNKRTKTNSLTTLDLSENDMSGWRANVMADLFDDCNSYKRRLKLCIDSCRLHDDGALALIRSLSGCKMIETISMKQNGFIPRQRQLRIMQEDERLYRTQTSNINFAFKDEKAKFSRIRASNRTGIIERSRKYTVDEKAQAVLPSLLIDISDNRRQSATNLKELYISSDSEAQICHDRRRSSLGTAHFVYSPQTIMKIADALKINTSLRLLDVSGNLCGNSLAIALGYMLPQNNSLRTLYWDNNCTNIVGFTSFLAGLQKNQTLSFVQMPIRDIQRILKGDNPPRKKLFSVLNEIFRHVESRAEKSQMEPSLCDRHVGDS